jgi:NAD(P)-dependent dehydrogenase (short-subunit alcohol dehydrogenase family)
MTTSESDAGATATRDRVACVTGGGKGLGRAVAHGLAREGATVIVADIDIALAEEAVREIEKNGGRADPLLCDVGDENDVQRAFDAIRRRFGRLDVLVANAGIFPAESGLDTPLNTFDRILGTNFRGAYLSAAAAMPMLLETRGSMVFLGSSSASYEMVESPAPGADLVAIYAGSKAALERWALQLSKDYEALGVNVRIFRPGGGVLTDAFRALNKDEGGLYSRVPTPHDVAPAVVWLCGDAARHMPERLVSGLAFRKSWGPNTQSEAVTARALS